MNNLVSFFGKETFPLEMHKVRIVQKLHLVPVEDRIAAINDAGYNTFLLKNKDVFLDMLTDSGVNAMSDRQQAAMMQADDSYAGSMSFERLKAAIKNIFNKDYVLPVHQGRAAENVLANAFIKPGHVVPMNYHFTTTKAHIMLKGGKVEELYNDEALNLTSSHPFKGNMDLDKLQAFLVQHKGNVPFVRVEAGTNLIGGQPWSLANYREVAAICKKHGVPLVLDASLLADNLYFIKTREEAEKSRKLADIMLAISDLTDIIYFSARKLGCARGGAIITSDPAHYDAMVEFIPLFEGFLTYGGVSVREIEAITVGLEETLDFDMVRHGPEFISYMVQELEARKIPVVTPAGGLGCHLNARAFLPHVSSMEYTSGALAAALYIAGGIRGMERGTMSETRNSDGSEHIADAELLRLAMPRRVFTMSQIKYAVDRIHWLYENRELVGGLKWTHEPKILRFFTGKLAPVSDWPQKLAAQFRKDFGSSL